MRRLLRIDRWILEPFTLLSILFLGQAVTWYLLMPEVASIPGAAPRYIGELHVDKMLILSGLLLIGIVIGKAIVPRRAGNIGPQYAAEDIGSVRFLSRFADWMLLVFLIGECVYARQLFANSAMVHEMFALGNGAYAGLTAADDRIVGLSSLNNIFPVPTAVWSLIAFNRMLPVARRRSARRRLVVLGCILCAHSLLFAARLFIIYFVCIIIAAHLRWAQLSGRRLARKLWVGFAAMVLFVWAGETFRAGLQYSTANRVGLFTVQTQTFVFQYLIEGYFAADANNALIVLDCPPSMQWISTTALRSIGQFFGHSYYTYAACPAWVSRYGTMNVVALWWFDAGWFGAGIALLAGLFIGITFRMFVRSHKVTVSALFYPVAFPAVLGFTRTNSFGLTSFLIPLVVVSLAALLRRRRFGIRKVDSAGTPIRVGNNSRAITYAPTYYR